MRKRSAAELSCSASTNEQRLYDWGQLLPFEFVIEIRKEEKQMKKRTLLVAILCALSLTLTACGDNKTTSDNSQSSVTSTTQSGSESPAESTEDSGEISTDSESSDESSNESSTSSVWDSAKYKEDTELGQGAVTVKIEVTAAEKTVTLTVKTDETNLEKLLVANELVEGDESEFGLYIKVVNGIRADYDLDHAYWAIEKDGAPTPTGANGITVADGETYALVYTAA